MLPFTVHHFYRFIVLLQSYSCWSMIALLTLMSDSVYDVQEIITCLLKSSSTTVLYDILECLHCLALVFFALMEKHPTQSHFTR